MRNVIDRGVALRNVIDRRDALTNVIDRGVALTNVIDKILDKVVLGRNEELLSSPHAVKINGYHSKRSTTQCTFAMLWTRLLLTIIVKVAEFRRWLVV